MILIESVIVADRLDSRVVKMHAVTYHVVATDKGKAYFECEFNDIVTELTNDPIVALDPKRVLELDPLSRGQTVPIELRTLHCRAFDPQKRTQGPPVNTYGLPFLHVAFWPMILKIGTCSKNDPSVIDFCKCIVADAEAREIMIETHLTGMAREEALPCEKQENERPKRCPHRP